MVPISGVLNLGKIGPDQFAREIAESKMLVGIGQVRESHRVEDETYGHSRGSLLRLTSRSALVCH